jgi:hypothetical protein
MHRLKPHGCRFSKNSCPLKRAAGQKKGFTLYEQVPSIFQLRMDIFRLPVCMASLRGGSVAEDHQ